jgi:multicomponent Na+:H+ antiporter subunit D
MDALLVPAPILLPLAVAFLCPIIEHFSRALRTLVVVLSAAATFGLLLSFAPRVFGGETIVYWMSDWVPRLGTGGKPVAIGISLTIDAWGLLIALVAAGVSTIALIHASSSMRFQTGRGPFYVLMMLLLAALVGFSLSGDLFNQFVWLEVFSVAAFALTGFNAEENISVEGAFKYLITNSIASFFIAVGLALLYMNTGALNLAHVARDFVPNAGGWVGAGFLIGGYATKAALLPWHFWLPDAHTVAPAPVSAVFSGALIKVGIYAVARCALTLVPLPPLLQSALLAIACLTILVGGLQMLQQQSMKRVLAFSSMAQMGYILLGLALHTPFSIAAASLHIISHAMLKAALFLSAGNVVSQTGLHNLEEGGNLARRLPITCLLMTLASWGLAGLPLFSAFMSKTMLEEAASEVGLPGLGIIAIIGSMLTFAGLSRMLWLVFGPRPELHAQSEQTPLTIVEAPVLSLLPIAVMVIGSVVVGLRPDLLVDRVASPAAYALYDRQDYVTDVMGVPENEASPSPDAAEPHETEAHEIIHAPAPLDLAHWGIPLLVALGGSLITVLTLNTQVWTRIPVLHPVMVRLRRLHSGIVGDYALWNAFGTALVLLVILFATRRP